MKKILSIILLTIGYVLPLIAFLGYSAYEISGIEAINNPIYMSGIYVFIIMSFDFDYILKKTSITQEQY